MWGVVGFVVLFSGERRQQGGGEEGGVVWTGLGGPG